MFKHLLALAAVAAIALPAQAAINIGSPATTYSQDFSSLTQSTTASAWANDSTLTGWSLFISSGAAAPTIVGGTGSSNAGSFYSFGAASSGDRALGSAASGGTYFGSPASGAVAGWIAVAFTNGTGAALAGFTLGYDGEQWRNGGNTSAQSLVLQYGYGASFGTVASWVTPGGSFDFSSPVVGATGAAVDGNGAGLVSGLGGSVSTSWAAGDTLWLRWADANDVGNDHGLAIDNLSFAVTAVPEPGAMSLLLAGLAGVGCVARRRKA